MIKRMYGIIIFLIISCGLFFLWMNLGCGKAGEQDEKDFNYYEIKEKVLSIADGDTVGIVSYIKSIIDKHNEEGRAAIIFSLTQLDREKFRKIIGAMTNAESPEVRSLAIEAVGVRSESSMLEAVKHELRADSEELQYAAAQALAAMDYYNAKSIVEGMLRTEDADIFRCGLYILERSRYNELYPLIIEYLLNNWENLYLKDKFINILQVIRRYYNEMPSYGEPLRFANYNDVRAIRFLGLKDDNKHIGFLKRIILRLIKTDNDSKKLDAALEAFSLYIDTGAIHFLFNQYRSAQREGRAVLSSKLRDAIDRSYRLHRSLILNGRDEFRIKALISFKVFSSIGYKDSVEKTIAELIGRKIRNPIVANVIRSYHSSLERKKSVDKF